MDLKDGTTIQHYRILSEIGKGGMGEVYLAEDTRLERQVALKVLLAEVAGDQSRLRRFVREAKAASALNHPNILTVYEIGDFENSPYIATELIKGETLRQRLEGEPLSLREVLDIAVQISAALNAAHGAGIVHRDIKPENIMLRDDGLVKVLDFGLAKLAERKGAGSRGARKSGEDESTLLQPEIKNLTSPGMVVGTVAYMSPEQARGKTVDARSDIWSLGVVVYEMLTGQPPFAGETTNDSIAAILRNEPPPLDETIPEELRRILRKTLRKNADERYQTVKDFLIDVKDLKHELEFSEELERSQIPHAPGSSNVSAGQISGNATGMQAGVISTQNSIPPQRSSAEYLVSQVRQHKFRALLILSLAVLIIAGAGYGIYRFSKNESNFISLETAKITPLTSSGRVVTAAISPDGKWLAYVNADGDKQSLWVQQVAVSGSSTEIDVPAVPLIVGVAFSPDSNYIFYTAATTDLMTGTLYQVPVMGGIPRKIMAGIVGKVSFSPDGTQFTFFDYQDRKNVLMIAKADGSDQRKLTGEIENISFPGAGTGPAWSPDGKTVLTAVRRTTPPGMTLATVSVETGEISLFCPQSGSWVADPSWSADGKNILVLAGGRHRVGNIWHVTYPSGEARQISNDVNGYSALSLTADSNTLALVQGGDSFQGTNSWTLPKTGTANIWTSPINDTSRALQVTSGSDRNHTPSWTPDGKIVYVKDSGRAWDLYIVDPSRGIPLQLTANSGANFNPAASPDGRFIVFTSNRTGTPSLWRIGVDGSNPLQLTTLRGWDPNFSPDGREVIFYSVTDGVSTIWKVGVDGGEPVQLTDVQSDSPVFSPDGKHLVCSYHADPKVWPRTAILESGGGTPVTTFTIPAGYSLNPRWMPDGRSIVYGVTKGGVTNLWAQPIDGGPPKQITKFTNDLIQSFDISRDGKQIAFTKRTGTSDVVLITGFRK